MQRIVRQLIDPSSVWHLRRKPRGCIDCPKDKVPWQSLRPSGRNTIYSPVEAADDQLRHWSSVWRVDDPIQNSERPWLLESVETLEDADMLPITVASFENACCSIRWGTGLGSDYFHPRQWRLLSDDGKARMVEFLNLVEA